MTRAQAMNGREKRDEEKRGRATAHLLVTVDLLCLECSYEYVLIVNI